MRRALLLGHSSVQIDPNDIDLVLEQRHRDAMLDLVLAWGSLDGALGMLLSRLLEKPFDQGAELIGRASSSLRLAAARIILRNAPEAARIIKRHKNNYERHSRPRNRIAHSHCAGVWTRDREFIVFQVFEKVGENELALDVIPIEVMQRATEWGREMTALALRLADAPLR
jgi:hypothetical protein